MYKLNFIPSPGATPLPIYHPNGANEIDKLIIIDPAAHLEVNTAGSMHFDLNKDHPYIGNITIMKGILELLDGSVPIFRGRVTRDSQSFYLRHQLSAEGMLACLNDSIVEPFNFPEDWANDPAYRTAAASGNVVQFFLKWLLDSHNAQVGPEQQIKLGTVTVTDSNNYITRSSEKYEKTWATCKDKLFGSSLGGYFLMRYETDGNYLDYVEDFPLTNVQHVAFAENLLDLTADRDGTDLYTAILPVGKDGLTIAQLPDESIDSDLMKSGAIIYSRSMEQEQGGRITKVVEFGDVTAAGNLRSKAAAVLAGVAMPETISCRACDLHGIDGEVPSFRVGRYTEVYSQPHGYSSTYPLMALDIDILNPGNTPIVLNRQQMSLTRTLTAGVIKPKDGRDGRDGRDGLPGKDGVDGKDGAPGKDGVDGRDGSDGTGISAITSEYRLSTSDSELTGGAWVTTVPTITDGTFLWTRDNITYTDGSSSYTAAWCLTKGVRESAAGDISEAVEIGKQNAAAIVEDSQSVLLEAMSKYSEQSSFEEFKRDMDAKLQVLDEGIEARVSRTEISEITTAQGDVQRRVDTIEKYIKFDVDDGVTIGQEGSNIKQVLDNDSQKIIVNGQVVQELNAADGARYTSAKIEKHLRLGNLIIYVEPDGSIAGRRAN